MFLILVRLDSIRHRLAEYLYKVQIYVHEKISIYTSTSSLHGLTKELVHATLACIPLKRSGQFNQVSTLDSIGGISPRFSYCSHYVLCNVLLSFSCFSFCSDIDDRWPVVDLNIWHDFLYFFKHSFAMSCFGFLFFFLFLSGVGLGISNFDFPFS